eukprot:1515140-Prymnesium_polylepis.1
MREVMWQVAGRAKALKEAVKKEVKRASVVKGAGSTGARVVAASEAAGWLVDDATEALVAAGVGQ